MESYAKLLGCLFLQLNDTTMLADRPTATWRRRVGFVCHTCLRASNQQRYPAVFLGLVEAADDGSRHDGTRYEVETNRSGPR